MSGDSAVGIEEEKEGEISEKNEEESEDEQETESYSRFDHCAYTIFGVPLSRSSFHYRTALN